MTINVVDECIRFNIYLNTMKTYLNAKHIHTFGWMWQKNPFSSQELSLSKRVNSEFRNKETKKKRKTK